MKRRISLVLALTLSFLMMFSAIAKAGEVTIQITVTTSEPDQIEVVKTPSVQQNKVDCPLPQEKASNRVLQEGKENGLSKACGQCITTNGKSGSCMQIGDNPCAVCKPCFEPTCGECYTPPPENLAGIKVWLPGNQWYCRGCIDDP